MYIVVPFQMFDAEQNILFYNDNDECIKKDYVATPNLAAALYGFCAEDPTIERVDIVGNPAYVEKIKRQMKTKFAFNDQIEINIIQR